MERKDVDHKAEALRQARQWADTADREGTVGANKKAESYAAVSSAYSNLAIAEGQERVVEEIKAFRELIAGSAYMDDPESCLKACQSIARRALAGEPREGEDNRCEACLAPGTKGSIPPDGLYFCDECLAALDAEDSDA